jgi:hypothetical protein
MRTEKIANTGPGALVNASMLSAVQLRGNVVRSTIETDIGSKTGFWHLSSPQYTVGMQPNPETINNICVEIGLSMDAQGQQGKSL